MRLADDITVTIGGEAIRLRPCLRYAIRLVRRPGSFASLVRDILDGSLSAAVEMIRDHSAMPDLAARVLEELDDLREPLLAYATALAGIDPDDNQATDKNDNVSPSGKTVTFSDYLANLYRIGTGWLGWTPDTTLDATPAEIMEAYRGRLDLLKAVFGSSEQSDPKPSSLTLDDKLKTAFQSFGTTKVQRKKKAA